MADDKNSTRAGRSIDNLDDRKNPTPVDPGEGITARTQDAALSR